MKRIVLLVLLLLLLSGCAAKPTDEVYYVLGDGLYRTDGETTERVFQAEDLYNRVAQVGNRAYFYRGNGLERMLYYYNGHKVQPLTYTDKRILPEVAHTKRFLATERGVFLHDRTGIYYKREDSYGRLIEEVDSDSLKYIPDVDGDWFYSFAAEEGENGNWHLWYWQVDLNTNAVTKLDLNEVIPDRGSGVVWADNGTIWIETSTMEQTTACIQQWDPQTGTLLAELPRYHDGYYIVHMEVHDGMLFFIDRCELWVRLPDGTLHELMELPEGPLYDYENFPPAMYYGESAMVVVIDDSATYIAYPQNKS